MGISVIIPTLNEAENLKVLIPHLWNEGLPIINEIIVVDGGSNDSTPSIANSLDVKFIQCEKACRATQLNLGAEHARSSILYFVHADSLPPIAFADEILRKVRAGYKIGCFRFKFDSKSWMLAVNSWFTRLPFLWCRGGDQSLFITRDFFKELNGFDEQFVVMEDFDLIRRAKIISKFTVIQRDILVSARKYQENSYLRVNLANLFVFIQFIRGKSPSYLKQTYYRLIRHPKANKSGG